MKSWKELCGHLYVKVMIAVNIELILMAFVLDMWSLISRL